MDNMNQVPPTAPNPVGGPQDTANKLAIASLVCGILGIVGSFIPIVQYFTTVLSILGIVFGVKARKQASADKRGMATAGLALGIVALALGVLGIICIVCSLGVLAAAGAGAY